MTRGHIRKAILAKLADRRAWDVAVLYQTLAANPQLDPERYSLVLDELEQTGFIERITKGAAVMVRRRLDLI